MVVQLEAVEREVINPVDLGAGITMLEIQKNLMCIPSITNVPMLLNLSTPLQAGPATRAPAPSHSPAEARVATP
jgi:hypothetical protein